jgi:hypothetical protein
VDVFGEHTFYNGRPLAENKVLSDRRAQGAGVAYTIRFKPPAGKLLKVVATARSDEHVYLLEGGYCNRVGEPIASPGAYGGQLIYMTVDVLLHAAPTLLFQTVSHKRHYGRDKNGSREGRIRPGPCD